ncbi:MAG TPA: sulfur carrier protein ThiS [Candidatus Bariatricus faecipullorum]|nr:sulfur carrier protein ThiS [Candidatus Bariatricus faecipullorum]
MIQVNGNPEEIREGMTLEEYVKEKGYRLDRIAVERNGEIVPKAKYPEVILCPGDKLEVVSFVGGG